MDVQYSTGQANKTLAADLLRRIRMDADEKIMINRRKVELTTTDKDRVEQAEKNSI